MTGLMPILFVFVGAAGVLALLVLAFMPPATGKASRRRLADLKERHAGGAAVVEAQVKRILAQKQATKLDSAFATVIPNPALLQKRIAMTGKSWTVAQYGMASVGIAVLVAVAAWTRGLPWYFSIAVGLMIGLAVPHIAIGSLIKKRITKFTARFPDALELLVRGLRSGLPITETMGIVASEVPGPIGVEFRNVSDKMKIGRTMDVALQETADRLGTPEFQFFTITLAIQRETGGNLAETLSNLADVLRKRAQMKLKIAAMSSESKASAYIIGALPFLVFGIIMYINPKYMGTFFTDERLIITGLGGLVWMGIGAFIMRQMINFEI